MDAVHLAIALAYHGLLRVPSRAETSDVTPCKLFQLPGAAHLAYSRVVTLSPVSPPALSLSTLIWRYIRQFVKMDAREALQYVYCVGLAADQPGGVGKEQVENAWELVRRIIVLANTGAAWEDLVGGFRPDGTRFVCSTMCQSEPLANTLTEWRNRTERCPAQARRHARVQRAHPHPRGQIVRRGRPHPRGDQAVQPRGRLHHRHRRPRTGIGQHDRPTERGREGAWHRAHSGGRAAPLRAHEPRGGQGARCGHPHAARARGDGRQGRGAR